MHRKLGIGAQVSGVPFVVSGTVYFPGLSYADDNGAFVAFPSGSTGPVLSMDFAYVNPGLSVGEHTVAVLDNLTGAAGLVSLEDGCINEFVQRGTKTSPDVSSFMEMGGREVRSEKNSRATETAVRGFWHGYRQIMAF